MSLVEDPKRNLLRPGRRPMQFGRRRLRHLAKDLGPRVVRPVYAVPKAGEPLVAGVGLGQPFLGVVRGADLVEHGPRRERGAAMRRALESRDRTDDARSEVSA